MLSMHIARAALADQWHAIAAHKRSNLSETATLVHEHTSGRDHIP